jgi:hypothetical protein
VLTRAEGGKAAAVFLDANFKPAVGARKIRTEVEGDGEQTVADRGGGVGERPGDGRTAGIDGVEGEGQVIIAGGGIGAVIEPTLIGERGARADAIEGCKMRAENSSRSAVRLMGARTNPVFMVISAKWRTSVSISMSNRVESETMVRASRR